MNDLHFTNYRVIPYALIPHEKLIVGTARLEKRHGAIVEVEVKTDTKSFLVLADLAPLQGFSLDGLNDGLIALDNTLPRWLDHELPLIDIRAGLSDLWEAFVDVEPDLNALSWCMFSICVNAHAKIRGQLARQIMSDSDFSFTQKKVALEGKGKGARKIKFHSREDLDRILDAVKSEHIRLDSNGVFDAREVLELAALIPKESIVYWEEPTRDAAAIERLRAMGFRIAKDESLMSDNWSESDCDAFVIKPTVLGWKRTFDVVKVAKINNLPIAISTAYESKVGRDFLKEFAYALGPNTTLGLGGDDLFTNEIDLENDAF